MSSLPCTLKQLLPYIPARLPKFLPHASELLAPHLAIRIFLERLLFLLRQILLNCNPNARAYVQHLDNLESSCKKELRLRSPAIENIFCRVRIIFACVSPMYSRNPAFNIRVLSNARCRFNFIFSKMDIFPASFCSRPKTGAIGARLVELRSPLRNGCSVSLALTSLTAIPRPFRTSRRAHIYIYLYSMHTHGIKCAYM